jgi:hypothetical protein
MNYPTSLDNGTTLPNTRNTGDTIPPSDNNNLSLAAIALETKVGFGASTPTTAGYVLTSLGSGQSAWQAASGGSGQLTYFNVKAYGAQGNGANDDTSAIQAAINAAFASPQGTGAVYFPAGTYKITATLNCSSATSGSGGKGVFLVGDGRNASHIFKNSNFIGCEWKGFQGPTYPNQFGGMRDITVNGNAKTGAAVHVVGGQQMEFFASSIIGNNDVGLDLDTCQDSYFYDFTMNNVGSTTKYAIELYGSTYGTTNMMWFNQIRLETFLAGAVRITAPSAQRSSNGGNNGFFFSQCKFENYPTVNGDICYFDSWTQQLLMNQIFISFGNYNSGYSTPANAITFGDGGTSSPGNNQAAFRDIFLNPAPTTNIGNSVININDNAGTMSGPVVIDNINSDANLNSALIVMNGASNLDVDVRSISGTNAKFSGDGTGHPFLAGQATLASGTVTVTTSRIRSTSRVYLTPVGSGSGVLYVGTITGGTSFVIGSSNGSDARVVNWEIRN